jgi:hypothetical protein
MLTRTGLTLTLTTIKNYSRDYGWGERVRAYDAERAQVVSGIVLEQAVADTVRHAEFGRAMQRLAEQAMTNRLKEPDAVELTGAEIARLGDIGVKIERMASGLASEKIEIMGGAYRIVIEEIGPLVLAHTERLRAAVEQYVRPIDDGVANILIATSDESLSAFAVAADRVVDASFRAQGLLAEQAVVTDDEEEDGDD